MWQFSHGKTTLTAAIHDRNWLTWFHQRLEPIAPGDALRCRVTFIYTYDDKGELIDQKIDIEEVLGVIRAPGPQGRLPLS